MTSFSSRLFLIFSLSLAIVPLFGQNIRFIELTVSDTSMLKVKSILYSISVVPVREQYASAVVDINDQLEEDEPIAPPPPPPPPAVKDATLDNIAADLVLQGFVIKKEKSNDYSIYGDYMFGQVPEESLIVTLKNEEDVKRLVSILRDKKGVVGSISDVIYEDVPNVEEINKRLYQNALKKATQLADISGSKVGQVLSISDVASSTFDWNAIIDWYVTTFKKVPQMAGLFGGFESLENKAKVSTMTFKFELK